MEGRIVVADLLGLSVVVTGAAGGVGKAVVTKLLAAGARICSTDVDSAVADLARPDGTLVAVVADVTKGADVDRVFSAAEQAFGEVNCVVSNAATIITKALSIQVRPNGTRCSTRMPSRCSLS